MSTQWSISNTQEHMQREDTFFPQKILKKFRIVRQGWEPVKLSWCQVVKMSGCQTTYQKKGGRVI